MTEGAHAAKESIRTAARANPMIFFHVVSSFLKKSSISSIGLQNGTGRQINFPYFTTPAVGMLRPLLSFLKGTAVRTDTLV